jgi:hypothetical protein
MPVTAVKTQPNGSKLLSNGNILTPEGRWSYAHLFHARLPKDAQPNQKPKYQCTLLFKPGEDISLLVGEVVRVLTEKFGPQEKWPKKLKNPILDQGDYDGDEYVKGAKMIRCNSLRKPGVVDARAQQIEDESMVYSGCFGRLTVRAYYYDTNGNKGVAFGLQNAQKTRDGDPLAGAPSAASDEFESFGDDPMGGAGGETSSADPLAGMMG